MCGIYGFIGKPVDDKKILKIFESLAVETEVRGIHATGYYGLSLGVVSAKAPLKASEFLKTEDFKSLYDYSPSTLIGHNRWASCGNPANNDNNHPFQTGRFGFIHNGIVASELQGLERVQDKLDITIKSECDSELFFRYFLKRFYNDHNHFVALDKTMKTFDKEGDFACALVDSKERNLYLFRNANRPLVFIRLPNLNVIMFASTTEILSQSLMMNDVEFNKANIRNVKTGQILKINEELEVAQYQVEGIKVPQPTNYNYVPKLNLHTSPAVKRLLNPKKGKMIGWECLICKKVFNKAVNTKQHIIDVHKMTDLKEIAEKIKHTVTNLRLLSTIVVNETFALHKQELHLVVH